MNKERLLDVIIGDIEAQIDYSRIDPDDCADMQELTNLAYIKGLDDDGNEVEISNTQRYKGIGNGWTIDVIAHILKNMQSNVIKVDFPQYAEIPDSRIA